jgi:hypothetical protein
MLQRILKSIEQNKLWLNNTGLIIWLEEISPNDIQWLEGNGYKITKKDFYLNPKITFPFDYEITWNNNTSS